EPLEGPVVSENECPDFSVIFFEDLHHILRLSPDGEIGPPPQIAKDDRDVGAVGLVGAGLTVDFAQNTLGNRWREETFKSVDATLLFTHLLAQCRIEPLAFISDPCIENRGRRLSSEGIQQLQ